MKKFEYFEFDLLNDKPLIDQLNDKGKFGLRFICMAQRISRDVDFRTGQPKFTMTLIYEREVLTEVQPHITS